MDFGYQKKSGAGSAARALIVSLLVVALSGCAVCANGAVNSSGTCSGCNSGFKLAGGRCVANTYTCENGAPQTGTPRGNGDVVQCTNCNNGFALDGASCRTARYTCSGGTATSGTPPKDKNGDIESCASCAEGFLPTAGGSCVIDLDNDGVLNARDVDDDGDGLIEIRNLNEFNAMRYNLAGTGYRATSGGVNNNTGCGAMEGDACNGYELMRSLDFAQASSYAGDTINMAWRPTSGTPPTITTPDSATNRGWLPISTFTATFEGNGNTISNLYARGGSGNDSIGLFGVTGGGARIRAIGVINATLYGAGGIDNIGALVGENGGSITRSYAMGTVNGGSGNDNVGALVGNNGGSIARSYATGTLNGGDNSDNVGGLVGQNTGSISASYARAMVNGENNIDNVGGLVGENGTTGRSGSISASYARATVNGGASQDQTGGLVGLLSLGSISVSYATGSSNSGGGPTDSVGRLVATAASSGTSITASYGFASTNPANTISPNPNSMPPETRNIQVSPLGTHLNSTVNSATALTEAGTSTPTSTTTNAGPQWTNSDANPTWQWDFGSSSDTPALVVDFNGDGTPTWQEFGSQRQ